jgi:sugar phosphate isomerase/epimerase
MNRRHFLYTAAAGTAAPAITGTARSITANPSRRSAKLLPGVCCYSYRDLLHSGRMTYSDVIDRAVAMGLDTVDLTVYWLNAKDHAAVHDLAKYAYRNGIHWSGIAVRTDFTGLTADERARQLDDAKRWVDFAVLAGAPHMRIFGGGLPRGAREQDLIPRVADGMHALADYAGNNGILLGIENDFGVTASPEQVLHYIKTVNSPWLGANLDTYNSRADSYEVIAMLLPYATHIHLKPDAHDAQGRVVPLDLPRALRQIVAGGYRGSISIEYELTEDPVAGVAAFAQKLRSALSEMAS